MKDLFKICAALTVLLFYGETSEAQSEFREGGFGGPAFQSTNLAGKWAFETGGHGGGYVARNFYVGGEGYGVEASDEERDYTLGYGGFFVGKEFVTKGGRTSFNLHVMGGYGGATERGEGKKTGDDIWVVRPKLEVEFPITSWFRLGVGGGYRWIMGSDLPTLSNKDLSANYASLTLRFGSF